MFRGVTYNRFTTAVLRERMTAKVAALGAKVGERRGRINRLMEEHGITQEHLSNMLVQYMKDQEQGRSRTSYNFASNVALGAASSIAAGPNLQMRGEVIVPAGVVSNIITEKQLIESETSEAERMSLILRNLRDTLPVIDEKTNTLVERPVIHTLSDEEIDYLGL